MKRRGKEPDTSMLWRGARVEVYSADLNLWVFDGRHVTIKPGESIAARERALAVEEGGTVRLRVKVFLPA